MFTPKSPRARTVLFFGSLYLASSLAGCSPGNTNEREFLNSAPPGAPSDHPDESYSQRRERTRSKTKAEVAAEAKNKAAEAKGAGTKAP